MGNFSTSIKTTASDLATNARALYNDGNASLEDIQMAKDMFAIAYEQGAACQLELALSSYNHGFGSPEDLQVAHTHFVELAELEDVVSQYYLAHMQFHGTGTKVDTAAALANFKAAGEAGHGPACFHVGLLIAEGLVGADAGGEAEESEEKWFAMAATILSKADATDSEAHFARGKMLLRGNPSADDIEEGLKSLQTAAGLKHPHAIYYLAQVYGQGTSEFDGDLAREKKWMQKAAAQGHTGAIKYLADREK